MLIYANKHENGAARYDFFFFHHVTIKLTKAEIAYDSSGSDLNKWLRNTLLLTFITTI